MVQLLLQQQYVLFVLIAFALIFSLTFHEYGHGKVASLIGDDTAKRAGRMTLNPVPHIDPLGLLMVLLIGIGYAKPVPTDPRNFNTRWGTLLVAAAGPGMNLLLAIVTINLYGIGLKMGIPLFQTEVAYFFFTYLALINMLLMLFNLLPIGPLDGSYILPYVLPRNVALNFMRLNRQYGVYVLLALIALNFAGVPVFATIWRIGEIMLDIIRIV
ncbi:MAG: site-2 protease family protein [Gammaproteobacteria bacterium]|nr:site-2 protease family protein [Gammaproteobacteria bacterium]MDH3448851.1 site-2 protease family protein [Gammaproteobacteria bacterium]